jgi:hypothetical protein
MNFDSDRNNYWNTPNSTNNKNAKEMKRNSYNNNSNDYNKYAHNDSKQFDNKIYYKPQQNDNHQYSNQNRNRRSLSTFPSSSSTNNNNVYPNPYYSNYDVEFDYQNNCYYSYDIRDKLNDNNSNNNGNPKSNSPSYSIAFDDIEIFNRLNREDLMVDHLRWLSEKPISVLQLDPADRAVLKIAGMCSRLQSFFLKFQFIIVKIFIYF